MRIFQQRNGRTNNGCPNGDGVFCLPSCGWFTHLGSLPEGDRHSSHIDSNHTRCTRNWTPLKRCHRVTETKADSQLPSWDTSWATCGHETPSIPNSSNILNLDGDGLLLMVTSVKSGLAILFIDTAVSLFLLLYSIPLWDYIVSCITVLSDAWVYCRKLCC